MTRFDRALHVLFWALVAAYCSTLILRLLACECCR